MVSYVLQWIYNFKIIVETILLPKFLGYQDQIALFSYQYYLASFDDSKGGLM